MLILVYNAADRVHDKTLLDGDNVIDSGEKVISSKLTLLCRIALEHLSNRQLLF